MARRKSRRQPLGTIWEIPDELWKRIEPILEGFWPKKPTGRRHALWRTMLNGIIFQMRSGCQWDQLPERYGPKSTVHDWFQRWAEGGVLERCHDMAGNVWNWCDTRIVATNGAEKGRTVNEIRGGSWYAMGNSCRSVAIGEGRSATGAYNTVGFRIVMRSATQP